LFGKYTFSQSELTASYKKMKDESYAVAETLYDGLTEGEALPDSYIAKYKDVILKRVVLAGARLAYAIE
jgi:hypothetical protein